MRRFSSAAVVATMVISMLQVGLSEAHAGSGSTDTYLALGDSLAAGFQPGKGETNQGYVDDLWRTIRTQIPGLGLRNLGCPGETSHSLIAGNHPHCQFAAGSQLDAAVAFLQAHPGQVPFITIDIGGNDLLQRCMDWQTFLIDKACIVDLIPRLQARVGRIVDALQAAAPGVPILAMTYYDPFLGLWGLIPGGRHLARADLRAWTLFNAGLATAFGDAGVTVADVAATFRIDDFTATEVVPGEGPIPLNVALACRWTWFCSKFFPDPHPNQTGYKRVAHTFEKELLPLLV